MSTGQRPDLESLQRTTKNAWTQLGARRAPDFAEVVGRYAEPHRAYHTIRHVLECRRWWSVAHELAARPLELEFALLYHDGVYDPRQSDNEKRSAGLFRTHAEFAGLRTQPIDRVCALIQGTVSHSARCGDEALLNDIDLAVLGATPARYKTFESQIRIEYAHVEDSIYRAARERVLLSFLERTSIYATPFFKERLEAQARRNLSLALASLRTPVRPSRTS